MIHRFCCQLDYHGTPGCISSAELIRFSNRPLIRSRDNMTQVDIRSGRRSQNRHLDGFQDSKSLEDKKAKDQLF